MKLLVERKTHIYVKIGMFNYCFIRVNNYMLVFVNRFQRCSMRNVVVGYSWILCKGCGFMSFLFNFLTLMPSMDCFAVLPATLVSELGCHVSIPFKQVGFELHIYFIYIYSLLGCRMAPSNAKYWLCH